jgi:glycosyltransferase involved in cell wall biosynthesis
MKMNHLLLITDAWRPQTSGVVTTLAEVLKRLDGWNVTIIDPSKFKSVPMPGYSMIRLVWQLRTARKVIREALDALIGLDTAQNGAHVHIAVEGPLGILARLECVKRRIPFTTAYHTNFPEYASKIYGIPSSWVVPFIRWFHSRSQAVLVPSHGTSLRLFEYGIKNTKIWGRGYDDGIFTPRIEGGCSKQKTLLYVGRVSREKNIEDFLKLQRPNRRLIVVGDGPALKELKDKNPSVEFVGFQYGADLANYYRQADVFVFPSRTDTLGVVMIEAIACGTPVAAYKVEGPIDVVKNRVTGVLVTDDLNWAVEGCLWLDRARVAEAAKSFSWNKTTTMFVESLVSVA